MSASVFHKQVDDSCTLVLCLSLSVLGFQMKRKRGILHHTQVKQNEYMEYESIYTIFSFTTSVYRVLVGEGT